MSRAGKGSSWHIDVEFSASKVDIVDWGNCPDVAHVRLESGATEVRREITTAGYALISSLDGMYTGDVCVRAPQIRCAIAAPSRALAEQAVAVCMSIRRDRDAARSASPSVKGPEVSASSTHKPGAGYTFVPSNLIDDDLATSWQPAKGARGPHWVRLDFAGDITVVAIDIANGFQVHDRFGDEFTLNSRIASGRLRFSDGSEHPIAFDSDSRGYTTFPVADITTSSVTILVDSEHIGSKWHDVAVSEVVVRQKGADK